MSGSSTSTSKFPFSTTFMVPRSLRSGIVIISVRKMDNVSATPTSTMAIR